MKTIKHTIHFTILGAATLLLSACGGGGGGGDKPTSPAISDTEKVIALCDNGTTEVKKGDKVTAKEEGTKVRVIHKKDGTKSVCAETGKAIVN